MDKYICKYERDKFIALSLEVDPEFPKLEYSYYKNALHWDSAYRGEVYKELVEIERSLGLRDD